MTGIDRLAAYWRARIALIRFVGEMRVNASVGVLMLIAMALDPMALARDAWPMLDMFLDAIGVR
jgi:hypothetical protein